MQTLGYQNVEQKDSRQDNGNAEQGNSGTVEN
jgi:hypothetical protein